MKNMFLLEGLHLTLVRAFNRGGNWNNGVNAGVFSLNLNNTPENTNSNLGFRCVRYVFAYFVREREQYRYGGTSGSQIHTDVIRLLDTYVPCARRKISDPYPGLVLVLQVIVGRFQVRPVGPSYYKIYANC